MESIRAEAKSEDGAKQLVDDIAKRLRTPLAESKKSVTELIEDPAKNQLWENTQDMFREFPEKSPLRGALVASLTKKIPLKLCESLTGRKQRSIRENRQKFPDLLSSPLGEKGKKGVDRSSHGRISQDRIDTAVTFIRTECVPRSGKSALCQRCTNDDLYQLYRTHVMDRETKRLIGTKWYNVLIEVGFISFTYDQPAWTSIMALLAEYISEQPSPQTEDHRPISQSVFNSVKKELRVQKPRQYWGHFECLICYQTEQFKRKPWCTPEEQVKLNQGRFHQLIRDTQATRYREMKKGMGAQDIIVTMDFSKYNTKVNINEKDECKYITDLIMVMEHKSAAGEEEREYVHMLCDNPGAERNDVGYVHNALVRGMKEGKKNS